MSLAYQSARTVSRAQVVAEAHEWIGTPYRYRQCKKGIAIDCVYLPVGMAIELDVWPWSRDVPWYSFQWVNTGGKELLLDALRDHYKLTELPLAERQPGDLIISQLKPEWPCSHVSILCPDDYVIHAVSFKLTKRVLKQRIKRDMLARFRYCFVFPGVTA